MMENLDEIDTNKNRFFRKLDNLKPLNKPEASPLKNYLNKRISNNDIANEPSVRREYLQNDDYLKRYNGFM